MNLVLLLRAPTTPAPDRYTSALQSASFDPHNLPVLTTSFHLSSLKSLIPRPPAVRGVIVTSARAAEAWGAAVDGVQDDVDVSDWRTDWSSIPFYTVGPSTASILSSLASSSPTPNSTRARLCPGPIRGSHTGTAESLAHFIVSDSDPRPGDDTAPLLYLTGDKNRDTLPSILAEARIELVEVQVYATEGVDHDALEAELVDVIAPIASQTWWIVFFAPSSAAHALPVLDRHFTLPSLAPLSTEPASKSSKVKPRARIAAIGRTTADFLRDERRLRVDAVPESPKADALAAVLIRAGDDSG